MNRSLIISISIGLILISLSGAVGMLFFEKKSVSAQLTQSKDMIGKLRKDLENLKTDKENADKEKEKSQKDALIYVELNNKIQKEKEKIQSGLVDAQKLIETKEAGLERLKLSLERTKKQASKELAKGKEALETQRKELVSKIATLSSTLKKEGSLYNYNLGVAYTQAKLYDEAIEAYEKALKINPDMAEAYYNLGLIYENIEREYDKALTHYRKYLALTTDLSDKEEVSDIISKLKQKMQKEE